ncbi:MAG: hypothetical protein PsegKO_21730 [Pseudohongiellaceae bacterium]|jgi:hypothetical protein
METSVEKLRRAVIRVSDFGANATSVPVGASGKQFANEILIRASRSADSASRRG